MKTLIAILWLLPLCPYVYGEPQRKELVITAESYWAVEASAKGYFSRQGETIAVAFNTITLARNQKEGRFNGDVFVEGVQVGLATDGENGWAVERWGDMLYVNQDISVGQLLSFEDFTTSIAVGGVNDLSKYWFVLKVDTEILNGQHGVTYSHSPQGLITED